MRVLVSLVAVVGCGGPGAKGPSAVDGTCVALSMSVTMWLPAGWSEVQSLSGFPSGIFELAQDPSTRVSAMAVYGGQGKSCEQEVRDGAWELADRPAAFDASYVVTRIRDEDGEYYRGCTNGFDYPWIVVVRGPLASDKRVRAVTDAVAAGVKKPNACGVCTPIPETRLRIPRVAGISLEADAVSAEATLVKFAGKPQMHVHVSPFGTGTCEASQLPTDKKGSVVIRPVFFSTSYVQFWRMEDPERDVWLGCMNAADGRPYKVIVALDDETFAREPNLLAATEAFALAYQQPHLSCDDANRVLRERLGR